MVASRLVGVLLVGALAAGCAHTQLLCPRQSGPSWRQYDSPHFTVTTDLSPPRARLLVADFERTYRSFVDVTGWRFPGRGEPPGVMRVVVFARRSDYLAVAPKNSDGYYRPDTLAADAAVVIDNDGTHPPGEVFVHELTHRLLRYYVPNVPLGLNEGLAEYFSTFTVRDGEALTGLPPRRLIYSSGMMFPSIKTLFDAETLDGLSPEGVTAFYLGGWFLVHTMARYYPMQLGDLLARLADGQWIRDAFFGAFGPDSWKELDAHYAAVVREAYQVQPGRIVVPSWRKPYRPPATVVGVTGEREVDDGALHLLWADLELGRHDIAPQVALAAAHGGDSAQLAYMRGIVALQRQDLTAAERDLTAAVDARPDEERYHLTLARMRAAALVRDRPHTLDAMAHDMEWLGANAKSADAHALVALYYGLRGDFVTAGVQAQRSLDLDPTCARGYLAVALLAEQRGDVDAALVAAERSVRLTPPEGARNAEALQLLAGLRARSRARSPLQPPALRLQVPALRR